MRQRLCIFCFSILYACNQGIDTISDSIEPVIIDVANFRETDQPILLSQFAEEVTYIPLSEDPLIGDAEIINLHIDEDTIYVDWVNIFKYTKEGRFIKKIFKEGQGPGEAIKYPSVRASFNQKERFFTFNHKASNYVVHFSFDGDYLGQSDVYENNTMKSIEAYFKDFCLYRIEYYPSKENGNVLGSHLFFAEDTHKHDVVYAYPNPASDENPNFNGRRAEIEPSNMNFIPIDSTLWFKHYVLDTLYSTSDFQSIIPRYIFKTDKSFMNLREFIQLRIVALSDRDRYSAKVINGFLPLPTGSLLLTVGKKTALVDQTGKLLHFTEKLVSNDLDEHLKTINLPRH